MSEPRAVGFLHIPKTAGMSVRAALLEHYPAHQVGNIRYDERLFGPFTEWHTFAPSLRAETLLPSDPTPPTDGQRLQLGHISLPGLQRLVPGDRILTVLREPRARLLSHHLYWAVRPVEQNEAFGTYQVQRFAQRGLRAFLEADAAAHQHDNLQCRMLVHEPALIPADRPIPEARHAEVAALAIEAVTRLGLVSIVEDPAMWQQLSEFVGRPLQHVRTNVTEASDAPVAFAGPQLDPATVALVEARNGADLILYHHVARARLGLDAAAVMAFANHQFVSQAERYGRVTAGVSTTTAPAAPVPAAPTRRPGQPPARRRFGRWRT